MKVSHVIGNNAVSRELGRADFLLTNRNGSYCYFSSAPSSRYQGVFFRAEDRLYRAVEDIRIEGAIKEVRNHLWAIERIRSNDTTESFMMPGNLNAFVYELSKKNDIKITLDIRETYDTAEFGRDYDVTNEGGLVVVSYQKNGAKVYLAIKSDCNFDVIGKWVERKYSYDEKRNSKPYNWWVYGALKTNAKKLVFAFAAERALAVHLANTIFKNSEAVKKNEKKHFESFWDNKTEKAAKKLGKETAMAYACARASLEGLMTAEPGICAGLPWFFQRWARDEAVAVKALISDGHYEKAKGMLFEQLKLIDRTGRMMNFKGGGVINADAAGWVFLRLMELVELKKLSVNEIERVRTALEKTIKALLKHHTEGVFDINSEKETWMDTLKRDGARIEIQALRLLMYRFMTELGSNSYDYLKKALKAKVRERFWNGKSLGDGIGDVTVRPNLFIAAYAYPELLGKKEWTAAFDHSLRHLWLDWGGVASLDTKNKDFVANHTGENPKSYHNGDSWYWLNNLAALVMNDFGKNEFSKKIKGILTASSNDILWQGAIGHHSELSSASKQEAGGCVSQAWSDAMFVELVENLI